MSENLTNRTWLAHNRIGRLRYLAYGVVFFLVKFLLDMTVARFVFRREWGLENYVEPSRYYGIWQLPEDQWPFYGTLVFLAVPFMIAGLFLTLMRIRDAGWPQWLVVLFFVPFVNLLIFLTLCIVPGAGDGPEGAENIEPAITDRNASSVSARNGEIMPYIRPLGSVLSCLIATTFGLCMIVLGTSVLRNYGWGLFLGIPFFQGMIAVMISNSLSAPGSFAVAIASLVLTGAGLLHMNLEGAACLLMAAPIALIMCVLGAAMGYMFVPSATDRAKLYVISPWLIMPLGLGAESAIGPEAPLHAVTTRVSVRAPIEQVWRNVIAFPELPEPTEWVFKIGLAYPIRATIDGTGVGAVRLCEFSTGAFVEPITVWDEPRRLAFDVIDQPDPLQEFSLYGGHIHPPHIEDSILKSERGQFLLKPQADGSTVLEGTTWYRNKMYPTAYWQLWSDWIIHRIHLRVLEHIKGLAEG